MHTDPTQYKAATNTHLSVTPAIQLAKIRSSEEHAFESIIDF